MRKYMLTKNLMIAVLTGSIYYKAVFEDCRMSVRIFGTAAMFVALIALLQMADDAFMSRIKAHRRKRQMRQAN